MATATLNMTTFLMMKFSLKLVVYKDALSKTHILGNTLLLREMDTLLRETTLTQHFCLSCQQESTPTLLRSKLFMNRPLFCRGLVFRHANGNSPNLSPFEKKSAEKLPSASVALNEQHCNLVLNPL